MLARVANNLFWMGRYIERSEYIARYLNVNYFSSLDAPHPLSQSRQFVLRSMLFMMGQPVSDPDLELDEEEVFFDITFNEENPFSLINNVNYARDNANSSRDQMSTELYESINKFYHAVQNYPVEFFKKKGLYDFTVYVTEMTAVLRGKIRGTILHDEIYAIIMLGINLERATQIVRIINAKYNDAKLAKGSYGDAFRNSYEWTTLLKCGESYDMHRRLNKKAPNSISTLNFMLLNAQNPKSVMNCLNQVYNHILVLDSSLINDKSTVKFYIGKIRSEYEFKIATEIEDDIQENIDDLLNKLTIISQKIEEEYFNY
ncbi:alpha-E domain-containing protein [Robertkochia solimangrovi]|uniref:alpha-E domain-containing protein n=1 Tax=Robertkochia solimangrovi TaxID=2213046 RepID=UPI00117C83EE|nr:alpha-E domain-containing protein [Robertkochia solimangrovi]TRZ45366.1 alpha-E domain-containing protein [Robertkochia solimangrovi]